jgi:hypothetical protein
MNRIHVGNVGWIVVVAGAATLFAGDPGNAGSVAQRRLLEVSDLRGPQAVSEARRRFESARTLSDDDRPVHYDYGVVLARLLKPKEALVEFHAALESPKGPFPSAGRAAIFLELTSRDWKAAAATARKLGDALVNAPEAWETDAAWSNDARWLGESVSAAQLLVSSAADVKLWSDLDQHLRTTLPGDLRTAYAAGFEAVVDRHDTLAAKTESAVQAAATAEGEKNEAVRKDVLDTQQRIAAQKENLKVAAEDWKKRYEDQMADIAKQMGTLEKDWTRLDNRRQSLERSILLTQQEITLMLQQLDQINSQNTNQNQNQNTNRPTFGTNLAATFNQQLGQRQQALIQYQFDWNRTSIQQNQVQQQAVTVLNQRQAAMTDYQQRSGQLVQQDGQLDKWNGRLNKQAAELEEPPTGKTAQTRSMQQKLKTVVAYLPWDWEAERLRRLAEIAGQTAEKPVPE